MYTTERAEQALDDIRKVFLLYERGIIKDSNVIELVKKITDIYVTKTVVAEITGQCCKTCLYYKDGECHVGKYNPTVNPNHFCDNWQPAIKYDEE